jgi:F-type H+-transporting ATPase subunit epsilon
MAASLKLNIYSPERKLLENQEVKSVTLTGSEGEIQILPEHENFIGINETGLFRYEASDGKSENGVISTGFFELTNGVLAIMAETLELSGEIDLDRATAAQKKAEKMLSDASLQGGNFNKYQLKLQRSLIRQQVAKK